MGNKINLHSFTNNILVQSLNFLNFDGWDRTMGKGACY